LFGDPQQWKTPEERKRRWQVTTGVDRVIRKELVIILWLDMATHIVTFFHFLSHEPDVDVYLPRNEHVTSLDFQQYENDPHHRTVL
jgi:hypothetical protein